ncbi:MAG: glycosyltransferase family 1 protein [Planctomycetes bacterium]|nr:glycosyltransferase family 1 protein [Planctomycetota bacterium]
MMAEITKCDFVNRLIFVNPAISERSILACKNRNSNEISGNTSKRDSLNITSKISVYTPINIIPNRKYLMALKKIETKIKLNKIRNLNNQKPYIIFMNCPNIFSNYILDELLKDAALSIFDFSDDFVELGYGNESIEFFRRNIAKYAKAADIVITVNDYIKKKYASLYSDMHVIRNATNYYNFDRKSYKSIDCLVKMKSDKQPIIGYSGIANLGRIDSELLNFLLEKRPDWQFVFVGPVLPGFADRFIKYKNVHYFPPVDYQSLPDYIHHFNVCIVPFKVSNNTKGNDLLKLHDYLAMGKPTVSTEIGGAHDLRDVVRVVQRPIDFLNEIERFLYDDNMDDILKRKNVALKNSWHNRVRELEELMKNRLWIDT